MTSPDRFTYYAVLILLWLCALWAYTMDSDAKAAQQDERLRAARMGQLTADRIERAAQAVCEQSHGAGAAHWWEGGVLVCARAQRLASSQGGRP